MVKSVYPHWAVEIENPKNSEILKVNCQRLKLFLELPTKKEGEGMVIHDPQYLE